MNEKISKRRIQITDLQKQEIEEKEETNKLIRNISGPMVRKRNEAIVVLRYEILIKQKLLMLQKSKRIKDTKNERRKSMASVPRSYPINTIPLRQDTDRQFTRNEILNYTKEEKK